MERSKTTMKRLVSILRGACTVPLVALVLTACGSPADSWSSENDLASPSTALQRQDRSSNASQTKDVQTPIIGVDIGAVPTRYLSLPQLYQTLKTWTDTAHTYSEYVTFGKAGGYDNVAIRVSSAVGSPSLVLPKVLINAAIHGDEVIGTAAVTGVIHRLISQYGKDATVNELVQTRDMYFVPVNNPPGYVENSRYETGEDPNRMFPWPGDIDRVSTPSIQNLQSFFISRGFNAVFDTHASGRMILLPWAYTRDKLEDGFAGAKHRNLGQELATLSGYRWGSIPNMIGYTAPGSSIDFWYIEGKKRGFHTMAIGAEVGTAKRPSASQIPDEINRHYPIVTRFIQQAPVALVTDDPMTTAYDTLEPHYDTPDPYFVPGLE